MTHPGLREVEACFVAPLRHQIEEMIGRRDRLHAARIRGVRMEEVPPHSL